MKSVILLSAISIASAFTPQSTSPRHQTSLNGGSSGYATTLEGKKARVEQLKGLLDTSEMIFTIPASSLTVDEVQTLRRSLPETSTMSVVKNKIMERATAGTDYEEATASLLKGANMWFFIEEDIGATVKAVKAFNKSYGKDETHAIIGGVVEGVNYDANGITEISKLPSKIELITKIAGSIKAVPTKVAKVIKAPGNKLGRAIKLATAEEEE